MRMGCLEKKTESKLQHRGEKRCLPCTDMCGDHNCSIDGCPVRKYEVPLSHPAEDIPP